MGGRLWDRTKSDEENKKVHYEPHAVDLLRKLQLPVPPELEEGYTGPAEGATEVAPEGNDEGATEGNNKGSVAIEGGSPLTTDPADNPVSLEPVPPAGEPQNIRIDIDNELAGPDAVSSQSAFCCGSCSPASNKHDRCRANGLKNRSFSLSM